MRYWKLLLLLHFLTHPAIIKAEVFSSLDSGRLYFAGISAHYGSIVTDSELLKPYTQSNPIMFQIDYSFIINAQEAWNQCRCYSKTGLSFSYVNFKNDTTLGKAINLSVFTEPYLYYSPRFQFTLRGGAGLSYLNNVYNSETNPENLFFSSPISFILTMGIATHYTVSPSIRLQFAAQFSHISNGAMRYPNWGINFPTLALGITYQVSKQKLSKWQNPPPLHRSTKLILRSAAGSHLVDGMRQVVLGINMGLNKQLSRINGIGIGGEVAYDLVYQDLADKNGQEYNTFLASVSLQNYFFYGKLLFGQQLAYSIVPPTADESNKIYQVYTLEYHLTHQWYAGFTLKTHGGISDYLALSISKIINLK